ncbi:SDR family NAD(P)-dependent oxidoreductase [Rhizobium sp. KDH_Rht_773_N]
MTSAAEPSLAVVVLGASRGIGRAIARVAARDGYPVVLVARSADDLAAAAAEITASGGKALTMALDLAAPEASSRLEAFLAESGLACGILVNSAGYGLRGAVTALSAEEQLGIIDVNIRALADMTLRFLPGMVARRSGGIINLGSIAGFTPGPYMTFYYASKNFVRSFSAALHKEVRGFGVTVTCVAPGPVSTDFLEKSGADRAALFKVLPKLDADYVAEQAWRGFKSGRRLVIPGLSSKLTAIVARLLPTGAALSLIGLVQRRSKDPRPYPSQTGVK